MLSSNAILFGAAGTTTCATPASPYVSVNVETDNVLSPGESSTVVLEFTTPTNAGIVYTTRVLTGPNAR